MHNWSMLSAVGLSLTVVWGADTSSAGTEGAPARALLEEPVVISDDDFSLHSQPAGNSEAFPFKDAHGAKAAATETPCQPPLWGESQACATFALASKASVEIKLLEVKDTDGKDQAESIRFRLYDVKGRTSVDTFSLPVGGKRSFVNNTDGVLDLVVHAKGETFSDQRNIRFTYTM